MTIVRTGVSLAASAAVIAITAAAPTAAIAKSGAGAAKVVHCYGINTCKGTSDCKTAKNDCRGQNDCKGQGFKEVTAKACKAAAGLAAGAFAATVYCMHCPEVSAIFVLTWYSLGILLAASLGALLGPRLLRW